MSRRVFPSDSCVVADVVPSPNFDERADGRPPDMIILHYTGMQTGEGALARLRTPRAKFRRITWCSRTAASSNWCRRASAPGTPASSSGPADRHQFLLDRHRNRQSRPRLWLSRFSRRQIAAVTALCSGILTRGPFRRPRPRPFRRRARPQAGSGRKISLGNNARIQHPATGCPRGAARSRRPRAAAVAIAAKQITRLQRTLKTYGYGIEETGLYDDATREVVIAFQRHFRPDPRRRRLRTHRPGPPCRSCSPTGIGRAPWRHGSLTSIAWWSPLKAALLTAAANDPIPSCVSRPDGRSGKTERLPGRKVRAPWTNGAG